MTTLCNHYNECGCEFSTCCFDCPLPVCKLEYEQGAQTVRALQKTLRIIHLLDEGRSVGWIMQVLGVSERTVYRAQKSKNTVTAPLTDTFTRAKMSIAAQ